jgi:gamma-glutamyltranspeptidase / glutathione hydrolase
MLMTRGIRTISASLFVIGAAAAAYTAYAASAPAKPAPTPVPTAAPAAKPATLPIMNAVRGDRANGWAAQARSEVVSRNGIVATSQAIASQAGLKMLQDGGNAFDAAVAGAAMMNVVEPEATGMGGDVFVIAWSAKDKKLVALNGSGRSPAGVNLARYKGQNRMPQMGIESSVVPGAVDAWDQLLKTYGTMTFKQVLEPAAKAAEEGFGVTERIAIDWERSIDNLNTDPDSAKIYLPGGKAPAPYSIFRNPDLGKAFRLLQAEGRDAFYKGAIAQAIVAKSKKLGGVFTMEDLAATKSTWETPISTNYRGFDVYEFPPNTQGFAVLGMLNVLDVCGAKFGIDIKAAGPRSPEYWHLLIEAKKLAYTDLETYNGDPGFSDIPVQRLISKAYAAEQCAKIDMKKAATPKPAPVPDGGTIYLAAADAQGNMVSFIYSVYSFFGSQVTIPGYGFLMNNRAAGFSLVPNSPNTIAPRKRPFHTIIPGFIMKNGQPLTAFGLMSGDQQAQGHAQVVVNMIDFGANLQAASDAARFNHNQRNNRLNLETELFNVVGAQLKALGHDVYPASGISMGGYQAISRDPKTGVLIGASDHRKDGAAVGW